MILEEATIARISRQRKKKRGRVGSQPSQGVRKRDRRKKKDWEERKLLGANKYILGIRRKNTLLFLTLLGHIGNCCLPFNLPPKKKNN